MPNMWEVECQFCGQKFTVTDEDAKDERMCLVCAGVDTRTPEEKEADRDYQEKLDEDLRYKWDGDY